MCHTSFTVDAEEGRTPEQSLKARRSRFTAPGARYLAKLATETMNRVPCHAALEHDRIHAARGCRAWSSEGLLFQQRV